MAGISAGNRALKGRNGRKLPALEIPRTENPGLQRAIENIAEHFRVYEGDGTAPKERFVTLRELEDAGLISVGVKSGFSYISQVLNKDVAQKSGSTANPTLKGTVKKDTALGPRTPGGGGAGSSNPIEAGKRSRVNKLSDIENVRVASPAQADFLYYDGGKWKNFSLFKRENSWLKKQNFTAGIDTTTLAINGVDIDTYLVDYVQVNTLTQTDGFVLLNRTNASNPALHVTQADAGPVARFGGGAIGAAPSSDVVEINKGNVTINGDGEFLTLKNDNHISTDVLLNTWIRFKGSDDVDMAWIGHGSNSNNDLGIYHSLSGYNIRMGTVGSGDILMTLGATGALEITGSSYKTNPTGLRLGQYTSTRTYIQAPAGGQVEIWNDGTAALAEFKDDNTIHFPIGQLHLGTFSTTAGGKITLYGTTASKASTIECTNGNLHIDSETGSDLYLNYYEGNNVYFGSSGGGLKAGTGVSGEFGSIQTTGTKGGYGGISLAGNFVLMNSGSAHVGLYDDVNNEWMILAYPNSYVELYYNGLSEFRTQDSNGVGNSTGAIVRHFNGTFYDVGMNQMPRVSTNTNVTLTDQHAGGYLYSNDATTYTVTLNNTAGGGADFPTEAMYFILNYGSGNINITASGVSLLWPNGSANSGNRVVGPYSVATILKYSSTVYFIWGPNIS